MTELGFTLKVFRQIGMMKPILPHKMLGAGLQLVKWGPGFPSGVNAAAKRFPRQLAIIDDAGELTWSEFAAQINQLTQALKDRGIEAGDSVALLCRNHRYMLIAMIAIMQAGGRVLLLNTMASRSQLGELAKRENASLVIVDQEFLEVAGDVDQDKVILAWADDDAPAGLPSVAAISADQPTKGHSKPARNGQVVIFTSGTTGLPKGARREEPADLKPLVSFFGAIPYRGNATIVLAAPLFHSWGLINFGFGLSLAPTYVLRRRFEPTRVIKDIEEQKADALVVVPLMMQRMVDADPEVIKKADVSSLKITASSGSALAGELANHYMDTFTDSVYNFYGATETGWVTIASPTDLREAPGTAGVPPFRTTVRILDAEGKEVPRGETGVIHVGNDMPFGGYTDGNTKAFSDGLMSTGDLGHFDENGRLFVSGRDDDMIISGGENVFPRELEDALIDHPDVADVVVTGIDDDKFGQVLAAYVVVKDGKSLTEDDIKTYAKEHVARFAVPGKTMFLDELPRNPTGKVMKRELPEFE
ncbi:fatty-acyl-CoA synthase [Aeromicrobium panaciterrae]|uniref:Fatty-acyl-CoA synthase n=1 Tax=Aeromicrobium panaciterrae TaxID=363861 RepID=A0ABU1ULH2_9ACTN|nr:AMP-binding protein [Aeromicrobium panaciterrae]MDR7086010.1 fatty-acyl-CoA synthase [Aeromicrobium panaciterrae]